MSEQNSKSQVEEQGELATTSSLMERIYNVEAPTAEDENGVALYVATVEFEFVRAIRTEGDTDILTIESSPEWGGTLIEESIEMEETRGVTEEGDVPSISAIELETLVP